MFLQIYTNKNKKSKTEMKNFKRLKNKIRNKSTSLFKTTFLCNILTSLIIFHSFTSVTSTRLTERIKQSYKSHTSLHLPLITHEILKSKESKQTLPIDRPKDRIFKGYELTPHEFPWMVKIKSFSQADQYGNSKVTRCGGALLNNRWVLTARHCITWSRKFSRNLKRNKGLPAKTVLVFLGSHGQYGEDGSMIQADKAIGRSDYGKPLCAHNDPLCNFIKLPQFMDTTFTNDIALVRLSQNVDFTQWISPVNIPLPNERRNYRGYEAQVSGWGLQGPGRGKNFFLKAARVQIVDGAITYGCNEQSGLGKLCAISLNDFNGGGSACPGDSGSPLVTWDDQLSDYMLIGIVSNGAPSCFQGHPSVFTEVAAYTNWIQKTIEYHDSYDLENEDSYLFYPYFNSPNILLHEPQSEDLSTSRIPRKIVFDELSNRPQIVTSLSIPRNLFSKFLSIFGN